MRKDGGGDETLEDSERAQAESRTEDGEETIEEADGPADFGEDEGDDLEDDEETVDDSPEDTSGLIRNGTVSGRGMVVRERLTTKIRYEHILDVIAI